MQNFLSDRDLLFFCEQGLILSSYYPCNIFFGAKHSATVWSFSSVLSIIGIPKEFFQDGSA
jgi:hypothetical protein